MVRALRILAMAPFALLSLGSSLGCDPDAGPTPSQPLPDDDDSSSGGGAVTGATGTNTGTGTGGSDGGGSSQGGGASTTTNSGPGGTGGAGGQGSTGVTVGVGGVGACDGGGTELNLGAPNRLLIRGTIVTPGGPIEGEILVDGDTIACVAASCAADPAADGATILETPGFVFPGLIDAHNHVLFNVFDEDDWVPERVYENHNQWPASDEAYGLVVDAKQYLNGEAGSPLELGCELLKYGEMKALVAGTTSMQGSPGTGKNCFESMIRSVDTEPDLGPDRMQTATIFPADDAADAVCANFADGDTTAYFIHVGEGVDETSRSEFDDLETAGEANPGCLMTTETTVVHGTAFGQPELQALAANDMGLVWSPKSNIFLYGGGTDVTKTTDIPAALGLGITVALGPDWSLGGSVNMLDELRFANAVDDQAWGDILTPRDLFEMATINAARLMRLDAQIGSLEEGKRADLFVLRRVEDDPYDALLGSVPRDMTLVLVDGKALYGDASLDVLGPAGNDCETIDICCATKFACIAENGGTPSDRLDQTFAEFSGLLSDAIDEYAGGMYAPIAPIVVCGE